MVTSPLATFTSLSCSPFTLFFGPEPSAALLSTSPSSWVLSVNCETPPKQLGVQGGQGRVGVILGRESEATQAWSTFGLLGGGRQPTSLGTGLASEKACPQTLWRHLETALCSIGKNTAPLPPTGAEIWAWGFRTQAKQLMGLLEAAKRGVSQSAELAGSRPNWRTTETAREKEAGGGPNCPPLHPPWASLPPHSGPKLRHPTTGNPENSFLGVMG